MKKKKIIRPEGPAKKKSSSDFVRKKYFGSDQKPKPPPPWISNGPCLTNIALSQTLCHFIRHAAVILILGHQLQRRMPTRTYSGTSSPLANCKGQNELCRRVLVTGFNTKWIRPMYILSNFIFYNKLNLWSKRKSRSINLSRHQLIRKGARLSYCPNVDCPLNWSGPKYTFNFHISSFNRIYSQKYANVHGCSVTLYRKYQIHESFKEFKIPDGHL